MKPPQAGAAPQQLALGAFPAVDQNSLASGLDQQGRVISLGRGYAGRGARKRFSRMITNHSFIASLSETSMTIPAERRPGLSTLLVTQDNGEPCHCLKLEVRRS